MRIACGRILGTHRGCLPCECVCLSGVAVTRGGEAWEGIRAGRGSCPAVSELSGGAAHGGREHRAMEGPVESIDLCPY